ncbi:hypothetical protein I350_00836 [Cryptococcus amylolentus CBS 6273]|uniref:WSC domain-containing protein n=1 Tax=Cryptococcus amylolentus CBS 6273 TaxID=1296118 RepID=A0A1E3KIA1_9TREE|nr:hypothetical protein I350_00836 [Cryptococcus amylolentus CBS 6273]
MLSLELILLTLPLGYALSIPLSSPSFARAAAVEQQEPSSQFVGCTDRGYIQQITNDDSAISPRLSNEACTMYCSEDSTNKYAYFNDKDSECYCSGEDYPTSSDIRDANNSVGTCQPSQTTVTYLTSPFIFTHCIPSDSYSPSSSSDKSFTASSPEYCLDTCNTTPSSTIAHVQPTYDAEDDWWVYDCRCVSSRQRTEAIGGLFVLDNSQRAFDAGWAPEDGAKCGFESVFVYERPVLQ